VTAVLVDTHVLLWAMTDPAKLTSPAEEVVSDLDTEVLVSAASAWEISTKVRIGKLPEAEFLVLDYGDHLRQGDFRTLPIESADALVSGSLAWAHRDPFDRIIAAQAIRRGIPLISADRVFDDLGTLQRIW
jgi:PIN domain nuclease of toxin-antitoxin system